MRKRMLMFVATVFMMFTVPAFAQMTKDQKDECLLASKNCVNQVDDIQAKMRKLDNEIKKGTRVYTPEELKKLEYKLKETQDMLNIMLRGAGGN